MGDGFTKLFSSIVTSSIWAEDDVTRIIWITMLALADEDGYVAASVPGLANLARFSIEETEKALHRLSEPDQYSRTKENDGRRIVEAQGGFFILNYTVYRDRARIENRKEWKREYMKKYMCAVRHPESTEVLQGSNEVLTSASASSSPSSEEEGCKGETNLAGYTKEFLEFWEAYPRKEAKGKAFAQWKKLKRPPTSQLLQAITLQGLREKADKEGMKFIPHPSSWLCGRRWEDEDSAEKQPDIMKGVYWKP